MNQVILIGNVGKNPVIKQLPNSGVDVSTFPMATSKLIKNTERTEWHNLRAWGEMAKRIYNNVYKGDRLVVLGELKTDDYEDRNGVKHYRTYVEIRQFSISMKLKNGNEEQPVNGNDSAEY